MASAPATRPMPTNHRRQVILRRLRVDAPALADLFETAVVMLHDSQAPGWPRLTAHAVREIGNSLAQALHGPSAAVPGRVEYPQHLDGIRRLWDAEGYALDGGFPIHATIDPDDGTFPDRVEVSSQLLVRMSRLVADHIAGSNRARRTAEALFRPERGETSDAAAFDLAVRAWRANLGWWVEKAHARRAGDPVDDLGEFREHFDRFELDLFVILGTYPETKADLDDLLARANG